MTDDEIRAMAGATRAPESTPAEHAKPSQLPLGYIVLIRDVDGQWHDDWDGEVHQTPEAGLRALAAAHAGGFADAVLTSAVPYAEGR